MTFDILGQSKTTSSGYNIETPAEVIEFTANKLGGVLFVLGGIHYFNMFNIARMRRKAKGGNSASNQPSKAQPVADII